MRILNFYRAIPTLINAFFAASICDSDSWMIVAVKHPMGREIAKHSLDLTYCNLQDVVLGEREKF